MADVTKTTVVQGADTTLTRSLITVINERYESIPGKRAGEDLDAGDWVFLWTDGKFYKANAHATLDNAAAVGSDQDDAKLVRGMVMGRAKAGYAVDVAYSGRFSGYTGLPVGSHLFLSDTAGAMADAAGTVPIVIAWAVDDKTIQIAGAGGFFPPTVTDT